MSRVRGGAGRRDAFPGDREGWPPQADRCRGGVVRQGPGFRGQEARGPARPQHRARCGLATLASVPVTWGTRSRGEGAEARFCTALLRYRGGGRSASAGQGGAGPGWAVGAAHRSHVLTSLPQRLARFPLDAQARPSRCPQQRRRALRRRGAPTPGQRGAKRSELAIRAAARKGSGARGRRQEEDNGPAQGKLSVWQRERLRREGLAVLPSLRGLRPGSPRAAWDARAAEPPGTGT